MVLFNSTLLIFPVRNHDDNIGIVMPVMCMSDSHRTARSILDVSSPLVPFLSRVINNKMKPLFLHGEIKLPLPPNTVT